ncbi:MAG: efflux RND transporter periplasmic adaptor subunit, partial [Candidatus Omnitrophota bacterium]|nr:efflux RND transporter periplasmic adaptor subunit [Candidatus Omnitrophota bacterium]
AAPAPAVTEAEAKPILVRAFKVKAMDFQDILPVMGTVKGKTEIALKPEINGVIQKIYFREGEKIKKGDLIASLGSRDAQLRVVYTKNKFNATQATYNSVQKKLEVHKKLYEAGAIIKSKLEEVELECSSAKFQVETARSEVKLVENELNKTLLYATTDGVMGPREKEEGEFVTPQDKIGSLFEISEVFVVVGIVERDINKIKLGQKAKIYVDAHPDIIFEGKVDSIFPVVEEKSRTLTAKIKVPNPEGLLFPGMFSRAEISVVELKNAFIIPTTCLITSGKKVTLVPVIPVETIEENEPEAQTGVIKLRPVSLGYLTSDYVQITKGLNANDLVVLEAQGELKDNSPVKIVAVEEPSF